MPYIDQNARKHLSVGGQARNAEELCHALTKVCLRYLRNLERPGRPVALEDLLGLQGALDGAKMEVHRRVGEPLLEAMREEHGDLF